MKFRQHQRAAQRSSILMVVLFVLLVIALVAATNGLLVLGWKLMSNRPIPDYFYIFNTGCVLLYVIGSYMLEVWELQDGGAKLAEKAGGRELLEPQTAYEKRLCNVVMEVAVAAGIRPPRIYLLGAEDSINAFAAGWDVQDAIVAVTKGSLERLTRDELQGVIAHEFGHIINGDMRLNMRLMSMVLGLQMLYNAGGVIVDGERKGSVRLAPPVVLVLGGVFKFVGWLSWLAGWILSASVSRQREFLADATAVKYTRLTDGLAGALKKIAYQQQYTARGEIQRSEARALAPLYLNFSFPNKLLATHPPIAERLKRLGVSSRRFEMADDVERVTSDQFLATRLVPAAAMTPMIGDVPADWEGLHYVVNVLENDLPNAALPDLDWSGTKDMKHFTAQQYLCAALTQDRLRAAVLAFWVMPDMSAQQELWETESKKVGKKIHYMMIDSVLNMAPPMREPMFERLILQTQAWSVEQKEELVQAALSLLHSYEQPYMMGWLRLAVMKDWLRTNKTRPRVKYSSFEQVKDAITVLSIFLAKCLAVPDEKEWVRHVFTRLKLGEPQWIELSAPAVRMAVKQLQKLGLMYPPTLMKVWVHEWELIASKRPKEELQLNADAFRLMCSLIDIPRPERLIGWFETPQLH